MTRATSDRDVATGKSRQLTKTPVLATLVSNFEYTADGKQIAVVLIPENRAAMPAAPSAPDGPTVKIADSDKNRLRTFPSLMSTTYQKQLLEWHVTGQVALIDVQKGVVKKVGQPVMVRSVDASPDGKYLRVTQMTKPFSYDVPVSSFGQVEEMWNADGKMLAKLSDRPTNLGVQDDTQPPADPPAAGGGRGANQAGKRDMAWRADGQGLTYLEQEPAPAGAAGAAGRGRRGAAPAAGAADSAGAEQGRGARAPERKDRLYQWLPPFDDASKKVLYESNTRMTGVRFSPDMKMIFFSERAGQNTVEYAVTLAEPAERHTLARYAADDIYATPAVSSACARSVAVAARRRWRGGGGGAGLVQLGRRRCRTCRTAYDKNPSEVGQDLHRQGRDQDGEKQRSSERQQGRVRARVVGARHRSRPLHPRSRGPQRSPAAVPGAERHPHPADEEPGLHARRHQRRRRAHHHRTA
jgi:hypothetical protein